MKKENIQQYYEEKNLIKIVLKDSYNFSGRIKEINDDSLIFIDKFNSAVTISLSEIAYIVLLNNKKTLNEVKN